MAEVTAVLGNVHRSHGSLRWQRCSSSSSAHGAAPDKDPGAGRCGLLRSEVREGLLGGGAFGKISREGGGAIGKIRCEGGGAIGKIRSEGGGAIGKI